MYDLRLLFFIFVVAVSCLPQNGLLDNLSSMVEDPDQATDHIVPGSSSSTNPEPLTQISAIGNTNLISSNDSEESCTTGMNPMPDGITRRDSPPICGIKIPGFGGQKKQQPRKDPRQGKTSATPIRNQQICPFEYAGRRVFPVCPSPLENQILFLLEDKTIVLELATSKLDNFSRQLKV